VDVIDHILETERQGKRNRTKIKNLVSGNKGDTSMLAKGKKVIEVLKSRIVTSVRFLFSTAQHYPRASIVLAIALIMIFVYPTCYKYDTEYRQGKSIGLICINRLTGTIWYWDGKTWNNSTKSKSSENVDKKFAKFEREMEIDGFRMRWVTIIDADYYTLELRKYYADRLTSIETDDMSKVRDKIENLLQDAEQQKPNVNAKDQEKRLDDIELDAYYYDVWFLFHRVNHWFDRLMIENSEYKNIEEKHAALKANSEKYQKEWKEVSDKRKRELVERTRKLLKEHPDLLKEEDH
jgi:hypothetical protein